MLRGVSLAASKGKVVSLIGSSGSGKSTLLRCLNLLEDSQAGEILFEGEPVAWSGTGNARRPSDRAQVLRIRTNLSMVFQQFNLWSHLSILDNVMEAPVTVLRQERGAPFAIARIEQLYPWPAEEIDEIIRSYPNAEEIVWLQEEPANMGAANFVGARLFRTYGDRYGVRTASRPESGSPACGSAVVHAQEAARLMDELFA